MEMAIILVMMMLFLGYGSVAGGETSITCNQRGPCFLKKLRCPPQCPSTRPTNQYSKVCFINCKSPECKPICRGRKPNCNSPGAACLDPRFIGGDGIVFYFHGRSNHHFALVSDPNLQINARFIGLRPSGRSRDFTWIQALGLLSGDHTFSVGAIPSEKWDHQQDHLKFVYDGRELLVPEEYLSNWESPDGKTRIERTSAKNSAVIHLSETAEISVNVVPVTEEDDRIHNYRIPSDDCFAHLEVQFRFYDLSRKVEGVLGRTYQPEFVNPAKPGVAMPVVGGEDKYKTSSLLSADCALCLFDRDEGLNVENIMLAEELPNTVDCGRSNGGNGLVCRK